MPGVTVAPSGVCLVVSPYSLDANEDDAADPPTALRRLFGKKSFALSSPPPPSSPSRPPSDDERFTPAAAGFRVLVAVVAMGSSFVSPPSSSLSWLLHRSMASRADRPLCSLLISPSLAMHAPMRQYGSSRDAGCREANNGTVFHYLILSAVVGLRCDMTYRDVD